MKIPEITWTTRITLIYLSLPEFARNYLKLPNFTWLYLNKLEINRIYLKTFEITWKYLNLSEYT